MSVEDAVLERLRHAQKTSLMWGSPEELDQVTLHLSHAWFLAREPQRSFVDTRAWWEALGGPFAQDAEEHAAMRSAMYAGDELKAFSQVALGFASVWAELERVPEREAVVSAHLELLLDEPQRVARPDLLNMVLFALMGFVARDAPSYVEALRRVREKVGGHDLRPLHVVAPKGPTAVQLTYTRKFSSWVRVRAGLATVLADLESRSAAGREGR